MSRYFRLLFYVICLFTLYHTIRDTLQVFGVHNDLTNLFHSNHLWCKPYCNFVTYPLDLLGVLGAYIVLKRNKLGVLGIAILATLPLWLLATILP
jgi:hypothetical protein